MESNLGEAAGELIGSIIGDAMARGDYEEADRLRKEAAGLYDGFSVPSNMERAGDSAFAGTRANPDARAARMSALERLQQVGLEGGMDAQSRAALADAQQQAGQYEQGQRGAILNAAQSRGMLGSNATLGAQLQAQQSGADRLSMAGTQAAGDARSRALQALAQSGQLAGDIERDDYRMQADLAGSRDAISQFNARNANAWAQGNFQNAMGLQDRRYGARQMHADQYYGRGQRTADRARGYGKGAGAVADEGYETFMDWMPMGQLGGKGGGKGGAGGGGGGGGVK